MSAALLHKSFRRAGVQLPHESAPEGAHSALMLGSHSRLRASRTLLTAARSGGDYRRPGRNDAVSVAYAGSRTCLPGQQVQRRHVRFVLAAAWCLGATALARNPERNARPPANSVR